MISLVQCLQCVNTMISAVVAPVVQSKSPGFDGRGNRWDPKTSSVVAPVVQSKYPGFDSRGITYSTPPSQNFLEEALSTKSKLV